MFSFIFTLWSTEIAKSIRWQVYLLFYSFTCSSHQCYLMVSHWSLSDSKSPQISRTLLSILADLNNPVVWMVFIRPLISKSSSPCTSPLMTVSRTPVTTGIIIFIFHSFFNCLARSRYLSFFLIYFNFTLLSAKTAKSPIQQVHFFSCWLSLGLIIWLKLGGLFVSQNPRKPCVSYSPERILGCAYTICLYSQTSTSCTIPSGSPSPPSHV